MRNGHALLGTAYGGLRVFDVRASAAPAEVAAVQPSANGDQIVRVRLSVTGCTPCGPPEARTQKADCGCCASQHPALRPIRSRGRAASTPASTSRAASATSWWIRSACCGPCW